MFFSAALLIALAGSASAQVSSSYTPSDPVVAFTNPPGRGSSFELASTAPCGGWTIGGRVEYPLNGGDIALDFGRDASSFQWAYSTSADPQSNDDFTQFGSVPFAHSFGGSRCFESPDLGAQGLTAGQNITLQFSWRAGPQRTQAFTCADLTLVAPADYNPFNYTCVNTQRSSGTKRLSASNPQLYEIRESDAAAAYAAEVDAFWAASPNSLSAPAAGGIGAGVTLAVVGLVLAALYATGGLYFGKRQQPVHLGGSQTHLQETKSVSSA